MNPDDPNMHAWLEPELEARIIASLLGEASAFEEAELQRLMDERPEVATFHQQLATVHGLVGEAVSTGPKDDWKLAPDRREKLLEIFGGSEESCGDAIASMPSATRSPLWWLCATATTAAAVVLVLGMIMPASMKSARSARAIAQSTTAPAGGESQEAYNIDLKSTPEVVTFDGFVDVEGVTSEEAPSRAQEHWYFKSDEEPAAPGPTAAPRRLALSKNDIAPLESEALGELAQVADAASAPLDHGRPQQQEGQTVQLGRGAQAGVGGGIEAETRFGRRQAGANEGLIAEAETAESDQPDDFGLAMDESLFGDHDRDASRAERSLGDADASFGNIAGIHLIERELEEVQAMGGTVVKGTDQRFYSTPTEKDFWGADSGLRSGAEPIQEATVGKSLFGATGGDTLASFFEQSEEPTSESIVRDESRALGRLSESKNTKEAEVALAQTLEKDSFKASVRQEMESLARTKSTYRDNAYDHTRAALLEDVVSKWEIPSPPEESEAIPTDAKLPVPVLTDSLDTADLEESDSLALQIERQEEDVENARLRMLDLAERYRITDLSMLQNSSSPTGEPLTGVGSVVMSTMQDTYKAEAKIGQLKMQIDSLKDLEGEELISAAAMLDIEDPALQELWPTYQGAKQERQDLFEAGLVETDPKVQGVEAKLNKTESLLKGAVKDLQTTLETELAMAERATELAARAQDKEPSMEDRRKVAEYSEARKEYALQQNMLSNMRSKWAEDPSPLPLQRQEVLPIDEKHTRDEAFSTFSLHVSDVSFKLAKAALLEQHSRPDPDQVRVEEFVNAFDYGDPTPRASEKVACRLEQAGHPFRQQRNLLRIALRTAEAGRSSGTPLQLTLLLDTSGSMERADRQEAVNRAIDVLASQLTPRDTVTLIGFARQPRLIADRLSGDALSQLPHHVRQTPSDGGTNLEEALLLGADHALRQFVAAGQNRIVLITDGAANLGDADAESLREVVVGLRQEGIAFDACGVGAKGLNDTILEALTREGDGRYYLLDRAEDADSGFARQLAGAFRPAARNVKVQVRFNPRRVGHYRLLGFEKHRLKKEDFRNDRVDAAEMAAAEAGVALYEVEPLPEGEGEIGEVFVRFQDTSAGHMVERQWTIPYAPGLEALDQATPSLQLASTAAFLAECLKGTPAGQRVDLNRLTPILTQLRQSFVRDSRVRDLIAMIEKAKGL